MHISLALIFELARSIQIDYSYLVKYACFNFTEPCLWKYGEFGECSVTCGTGIRERFPEITQHASNGGQDCPNFVHMRVPDQETCKKEDCPGDKAIN